jgi:DNA-binding NarL/FixJ family response regulator
MKPPIKIAIVDDHDLIREGLKRVLNQEKDFVVVAEAKDGESIVDLAKKKNIDVYIIDIKMPKMDGVEATRKILKTNKEAKVLALSFLDNEYSVVDMLEAGALGYMVKNADKTEIDAAVRSVFNGTPYFCEYTTPTLLELIKKSKFNPFTLRLDNPLFDEKERKIISLICEGKTSQEIGEILFLSCRTIEGYRLSILKKMAVHNTAGIILYAVKTGLYRL